MAKFETIGLDELTEYFEDLEEELDNDLGNSNIPLETLFNNSYIKKYTKFKSFDELLEKGKYNIHTQEDFESILDKDFDNFISENTKFEDWESMLTHASQLYLQEQFNF